MWGALGTQAGELARRADSVNPCCATLPDPRGGASGWGAVLRVTGTGEQEEALEFLGVAASLESSCIFEGLSLPASTRSRLSSSASTSLGL